MVTIAFNAVHFNRFAFHACKSLLMTRLHIDHLNNRLNYSKCESDSHNNSENFREVFLFFFYFVGMIYFRLFRWTFCMDWQYDKRFMMELKRSSTVLKLDSDMYRHPYLHIWGLCNQNAWKNVIIWRKKKIIMNGIKKLQMIAILKYIFFSLLSKLLLEFQSFKYFDNHHIIFINELSSPWLQNIFNHEKMKFLCFFFLLDLPYDRHHFLQQSKYMWKKCLNRAASV